jgi:hypothetical protein
MTAIVGVHGSAIPPLANWPTEQVVVLYPISRGRLGTASLTNLANTASSSRS